MTNAKLVGYWYVGGRPKGGIVYLWRQVNGKLRCTWVTY